MTASSLRQRGPWLLVTLLVFSLALATGRLGVDLSTLADTLRHLPAVLANALWNAPLPQGLSPEQYIILQVRLPRLLTAFLVGAGLALAGSVYQGVFRNPLVSPDILGVASGCVFGAALGLLLPGSHWLWVQGLAFLFGLVAVSMAMLIAWRFAGDSLLMMILTGIIVGSLFGAALTLLKALADPYGELPAILFWLMGSLSLSGWSDVFQLLLPVVAVYAVVHALRYRLNVLCFGDDQARSLGVDPKRLRPLLLALSSLLVAACVASVGQVAWVGLVVPHMVRTLTGANHLRLIPLATLCGGLFLVLADSLARNLSSMEIPIGVITSLVGAPLFALLLFRQKGGRSC
ncbi:iron ABC transporter permease [Ferrimonas balearica]|nr:iron ABC transporter permease [Ferrimonas balearica]